MITAAGSQGIRSSFSFSNISEKVKKLAQKVYEFVTSVWGVVLGVSLLIGAIFGIPAGVLSFACISLALWGAKKRVQHLQAQKKPPQPESRKEVPSQEQKKDRPPRRRAHKPNFPTTNPQSTTGAPTSLNLSSDEEEGSLQGSRVKPSSSFVRGTPARKGRTESDGSPGTPGAPQAVRHDVTEWLNKFGKDLLLGVRFIHQQTQRIIEGGKYFIGNTLHALGEMESLSSSSSYVFPSEGDKPVLVASPFKPCELLETFARSGKRPLVWVIGDGHKLGEVLRYGPFDTLLGFLSFSSTLTKFFQESGNYFGINPEPIYNFIKIFRKEEKGYPLIPSYEVCCFCTTTLKAISTETDLQEAFNEFLSFAKQNNFKSIMIPGENVRGFSADILLKCIRKALEKVGAEDQHIYFAGDEKLYNNLVKKEDIRPLAPPGK